MTGTELEVVDGELVENEPAGPPTLFGTSDPHIALDRMAEIAKVLVELVRSQGLAVKIRGNEHLRVEAWRALGGMIGVHPVTAWSTLNETGDGYLVRVEARTRSGEVVGASEAECSHSERAWANRENHALRAMAETRATSRALRGPLGQIVVLAGYEASAAEEMPIEESKAPPTASTPRIPQQLKPTDGQKQRVRDLFAHLHEADPDVDWGERARQIAGCPNSRLTQTIMAQVITTLEGELVQRAAHPRPES
jgi:hypothetical protein